MAQSEDILPLSPASPAVPTGSEKKEEEEEETALLSDKGKDDAPLSGKLKQSDSQDEGSVWNPLKWNWRSLLSFVTLWCTYVFVNASYSMIAPFFPKEVGKSVLHMHSYIHTL